MNKNGFTLLEIVIVLMISATLTSISLWVGTEIIAHSKYSNATAEVANLSEAGAVYTLRQSQSPTQLSDIFPLMNKSVPNNIYNKPNELVSANDKMVVISTELPGETSTNAPLSWMESNRAYSGSIIGYGMASEAKHEKKIFFNQ